MNSDLPLQILDPAIALGQRGFEGFGLTSGIEQREPGLQPAELETEVQGCPRQHDEQNSPDQKQGQALSQLAGQSEGMGGGEESTKAIRESSVRARM